jgi:hypothetical protein
MELVGQIGILPTSAGGALLLVFFLMVFGKIPTLRELRDSQKREERAMQLAENWQKVATQHGMALTQILDGLDVANHALNEIQEALPRPSVKKSP